MDAKSERWRAAVGANAEHYMKHFERAERSDRGWVSGWNSAACLHSTGWFWYRRMYGWAVLNFFAPVLLFIGILVVGTSLSPGANLDAPAAAVAWIYLAMVFIAVPVFADSLYYRSLKRLGDRARPPSAWTGLGATVVGLVWIALVILITIPAYGDYTPRAKVSEGASIAGGLKTPIAEFYEQHRRLPGPTEATQFAYREPMKYTASVGWDAARKAIVVTMADRFRGKRFEIAAEEKSGALVWTCRTIDLERKYLPGACRD